MQLSDNHLAIIPLPNPNATFTLGNEEGCPLETPTGASFPIPKTPILPNPILISSIVPLRTHSNPIMDPGDETWYLMVVDKIVRALSQPSLKDQNMDDATLDLLDETDD